MEEERGNRKGSRIAQEYRGYQRPSRFVEKLPEGKFKCTLGCSWSHDSKSNWERHEETHYPQKLWICFHRLCLDKTVKTRISVREDLSRRHHNVHHRNDGWYHQTLDVIGSLFPRKCVFRDCKETFTSWEHRSSHIEHHLRKDDELCREQIITHHVESNDNEFDDSNIDELDSILGQWGHTVDGFPAGSSLFFSEEDIIANPAAQPTGGPHDTGVWPFVDSVYTTNSRQDLSAPLDKDIKQDLMNTNDDFEAMSTHTDNESTATDLREDRLKYIADKLISWVLESRSSSSSANKTSLNILELLRCFSLRLGFEGDTEDHLKAMTFIHKYKRNIEAIVLAGIRDSNEDDSLYESDGKVRRSPEMSVVEKFARWKLPKNPKEHDPVEHNPAEGIENSTLDEDLGEDFDAYTQVVLRSSAFAWLRDNVRKTVCLTSTGEASGSIFDTIVKSGPRNHHVSRMSPPKTCWLGIHVDWDLKAFIKEQAAIKDRGAEDMEIINLEHIEHTITITGSATDAQALTCGEYLEQTWPCIGKIVLRQIKLATQSHGTRVYCETKTLERIPAVQNFSICASDSRLACLVVGEVHAVAEICEIIAWITSALQASPFGPGVCACKPSVTVASRRGDETPIDPVELSVNINFTRRQLDDSAPGSCWHKMFNNPVVVAGYPILRRVKAEAGLEISLAIISAVLRTQRITIIDGKLYIKAFSAMLIPTEWTGDTIFWHYLYDADGGYIRFSQESTNHAKDISLGTVVMSRCIVGFCSEAKFNAGSSKASLSIESSGLDPPEKAFALKGFTFSGGQFVTVGASVTIGHKDPSLRVPFMSKDIVEKLEEIATKFVVLWDCGEDRGWLIDGLSALLYLLRVFLQKRRQSPFGRTMIFKPKDMYEPKGSYPDAALDFFLNSNRKNMNLKLSVRKTEYTEEREMDIEAEECLTCNEEQDNCTIADMQRPRSSKEGIQRRTGKKKEQQKSGKKSHKKVKEITTFVTVQERVENILDILLYTIDLQAKLSEREGIYYKGQLRKHLEGWDFTDLATKHSTFHPVAMKFPCTSVPWIDLIRSIKAIVLFGRGFGDIIEPKDRASVCPHWKSVPKWQNYLCACVKTLKRIMEQHRGFKTAQSVAITSRFFWYSPTGDYIPCLCKRGKVKDTVQTIWPFDLPSTYNQSMLPLETDGAVVFGTDSGFQWFRCNKGKAVLGLPPDSESQHLGSRPNLPAESSTPSEADISSQSAAFGSTRPETTSSNTTNEPSAELPVRQKKRKAASELFNPKRLLRTLRQDED